MATLAESFRRLGPLALYGEIAYLMALRWNEIGVRVAPPARRVRMEPMLGS